MLPAYIYNILVVILVINAFFWGFFPHATHCRLATFFGMKCPPHWVHLSFGVLCFALAVGLAERDMFF